MDTNLMHLVIVEQTQIKGFCLQFILRFEKNNDDTRRYATDMTFMHLKIYFLWSKTRKELNYFQADKIGWYKKS